MHTVTVTTHLNASPEQVWSTIGDPGGISAWHPAITASPLTGNQRTCTLADGAEISEEIDEVDTAGRSYSYRITAGPLPVEGYRSTIKVLEEGDGSSVEWTAKFDVKGAPADDVVGMIGGVFQAGLGSLRSTFPG